MFLDFFTGTYEGSHLPPSDQSLLQRLEPESVAAVMFVVLGAQGFQSLDDKMQS